VYSKSLKRDVSIVIVNAKKKEKWSHKIYMTTDLELSADKILEYYQTRFQIEFLCRDGKQHTGLNDCQARSENKLDFHLICR
jgi:IS4 transposase